MSSLSLLTSPAYALVESLLGIAYHETLNPLLWDTETDTLRPEVKEKLLSDARFFVQKLDDPNLAVLDIVLTGSNAAYNYSDVSDIDVHIIVDMSKLDYARVAQQYFMDKKRLWSDKYSVTIHGLPVEFYVQDASDNLVANGEYSLLHDRWLRRPVRMAVPDNDRAVQAKAKVFQKDVDRAVSSRNLSTINRLRDKIKRLRASGLQRGGEYSTENLAFKVLRNSGAIGRLKDARTELIGHELSLF